MTYILNGTAFDFNDTTGELISLTTPYGRVLISNGHGLFDLAVPVKYDYEILRMKPNFMNAGKVDFEYGEGTLRVNYRLLGLNMIPREDIPQIAGGVEAELTLSECPDGRSVSMRLTVRNNCDAEVRQVIFPISTGSTLFQVRLKHALQHLALPPAPLPNWRTTPTHAQAFSV